VTAVTAAAALPGRVLTYNSRNPAGFGPITQPDAILYVPTEDLDTNGKLLPGRPIEPLILRARAGDCIDVTLTNRIDPKQKDINNQPIFDRSPSNPNDLPDQFTVTTTLTYNLYPSTRVGLHAQLVDEDVTSSDGTRVGSNPDQTATPAKPAQYSWYAGQRVIGAGGTVQFKPMELGTINLLPADPIEQPVYGAAGVLVVEPAEASWRTDYGTRAAATVFPPGQAAFREFVTLWQSTVGRTSYPSGSTPTGIATALNYRAEPLAYRLPSNFDLSTFQSNLALGPTGTPVSGTKVLAWDPQTPIYGASAGMPSRFRFANPAGQQVMTEIYGHHWQEEPWSTDSTKIAFNPYSENMGAYFLGPEHALNLVVDSAGGSDRTPGDYLYRDYISTGDYSMWGLFRVGPPARDVLVLTSYATGTGGAVLTGYVSATSAAGGYAATVAVSGSGLPAQSVPVNATDGSFTVTLASAPASVTARSANGGEATAALPPPPVVALLAGAAPRPAVGPGINARGAKFLNRTVRRLSLAHP
jgi:hypothetical protein